jgi:hypothetical protein
MKTIFFSFHFSLTRVFFFFFAIFCQILMGYRGLQCVSTWGSLFQSKLSFYMCKQVVVIEDGTNDQSCSWMDPSLLDFFSQENPSTSFIISMVALCKFLSFTGYFLGSFFVCFHWFFLLLYPISGYSQYLCLLALNSVLLNMGVLSIKHCRSCQVISFC